MYYPYIKKEITYMKTIILYGNLRKEFGKEFRLNVKTAAEAVRALCKLVKGFEAYLIKHSEPGFHVKVGREYVDKDDIGNPTGESIIRISPYIVGSKKAFKIIVGIALIAIAIQMPAGASYFGGLITKSSLLSFGISTVLGGISEALFSPPKPPSSDSRETEARPSYAFDGPQNTVQQGNPVPICYGELLVGSQVVSAVTYAKDI